MSIQAIMEELLKQHKIEQDEKDVETRIKGYLQAYRSVTPSRREYDDLTMILTKLKVLEPVP